MASVSATFGFGDPLLPAVIQFLEEIVHVVKVGPHLGSFRPALAHDVYRFRWRGTLADRRPDQGWRLHHFLDYICEVRSRDTRLNLNQRRRCRSIDRSINAPTPSLDHVRGAISA